MRLGVIARDIAHVIAEERPTEVAVERVFVNVNPNSTLLLGQARGAAIAAAVLAGLPVHEYTAGQVKQAVVGNGRALKPQVQEMVRRLLQLPARRRRMRRMPSPARSATRTAAWASACFARRGIRAARGGSCADECDNRPMIGRLSGILLEKTRRSCC